MGIEGRSSFVVSARYRFDRVTIFLSRGKFLLLSGGRQKGERRAESDSKTRFDRPSRELSRGSSGDKFSVISRQP